MDTRAIPRFGVHDTRGLPGGAVCLVVGLARRDAFGVEHRPAEQPLICRTQEDLGVAGDGQIGGR
jgi:hypothetical protein